MFRRVACLCADCQSELVVHRGHYTLFGWKKVPEEGREYWGLRLRLSAVVPGSWECSGADTPLG